MAVTATEARKNLFPLIQQVNEDRAPVEITSRNGDAVLMSRADYEVGVGGEPGGDDPDALVGVARAAGGSGEGGVHQAGEVGLHAQRMG